MYILILLYAVETWNMSKKYPINHRLACGYACEPKSNNYKVILCEKFINIYQSLSTAYQ